METIVSNGIRAESEAGRGRIIMLTETNYRVWASMTEQSLKEKKLWGHVIRTALSPAPARAVSAAVTGTPAAPGSDAVNAIPAITRAMVDHDLKLIEDFNAAAARASYTLMQTLSQKDISAVMILPDAAEKWDKLANDYAAVSASQSTNARSKFNNFCIRDGESVIETQHRFDDVVNECSIQAIILNEQEKTSALLMRPSSKWLNFMDSYATMEPLPTSSAIFRAMKSQEERLNTRNEREYEEANFGGMCSSRATQPGWMRRPKIDARRSNSDPETRSCYCCGEVGHLSATCKFKNETCEYCNKRGHLAKSCRARIATQEPEAVPKEEEESEKQTRPNKLSFAKGTKMEKARGAEGMVACIRPMAYRSKPSVIEKKEPEWLVDSGSSHHVCNDSEMMWNLKQLEEPVLLQGLVGKMNVTHEGTVKLRCWDDDGNPTELHLLKTLYVSRANTNLFSTQRGRKAGYIIAQDWWKPEDNYNESSVINSMGMRVGRIIEDPSGRGTIYCNILLPPESSSESDDGNHLEDLATYASANPKKWVELNKEWIEHNKLTPEFPYCDGADPSLPIKDQVSFALSETHDAFAYERETLGWTIFDDTDDEPMGGEDDTEDAIEISEI